MESGLVGLRAELHKKREEASKFGVGQRGQPGRDRGKLIKTSKSFESSNAGVSSRDARDKEQLEEERLTQDKARTILEKKAAMYERLHGGVEALQDDGLNQKYLVDFQKKIISEVLEKKTKTLEGKRREKQEKTEAAEPGNYSTLEEEEEWVEYTDVFGRTRECMKKDLPAMLEKNKELTKDINEEDTLEQPDLLSEDVRRQIQRQKWESVEEVNALKKNLHYQDLLFDEARTHGAGFMKFSSDEKERQEQMDLLKELRRETQQKEAAKVAGAAKQQKMLQSRLEKVRQRKRLKMGLPIKDDTLKTPPVSDDEDNNLIGPPPPPPPPLAIPEEKSEDKKPVREWDVGKEGVSTTLTQEEWVNRQRNQRNNEFAPPSSYSSNKKFKGRQQKSHGFRPSFSTSHDYSSKSLDSQPENWLNYDQPQDSNPANTTQDDNKTDYHSEERESEFAPPSTYEYYGPTSHRGRHYNAKPNFSAVEEAVSKGIAFLRKMSDK